MKTRLFIVSIAVAITFSQLSFARSLGSHRNLKPVLTPVTLMGTLRCEDRETTVEHKKDHECDLEFVSDEDGEVWNVKESPALTAIHQKGGREVNAHIEAMRSPRYLLGGNYVVIKNIETIPSRSAEGDAIGDLQAKAIHVCTLDTIGKRE